MGGGGSKNCHFSGDVLFDRPLTRKPYSSIPTNLWIEMTTKKGSKMKAGWQRILANQKMLCAHMQNGNYVKLRATLHNICNLKVCESGHKDNTSTRLKTNELGVQNINLCIPEFNCDPFDPVNDRVRTLHSGQYASENLEEDLLSAANDGEKKVIGFFKE